MCMQGFKSFAKKTELLFGPQFNCILGPNGSGKSNVLDALCFVLGKSSSKSLRAEKSANLIYNGGKKKNPAKDASVSIVFDNSTNEFALAAKTIEISRTVRANGTSKYKINGRTVNRNEVVELLQSASINPDGYNIILQGDITKLIEQSSLDRRRIIEEVAGISVYEEKKDKALRELTRVEERLKEADIILAERETYLRELKKERNQAVKFKELNDKIKRNKATLLHLKISAKKNRKDELGSQIQKINKEIEKIGSDIEGLKSKIIEKKNAVNALNREMEEKGDKDQVRVQKEVEELKVTIATNQTRISNCETEIGRVKERKLQLQEDMKEYQQKKSQLEREKSSLLAAKQSKENQQKAIELKIQKFKARHKLDDSGNIETQIETIDKKADEMQLEIQKLREEQQNLLRDKDRIEYQIQTADDKITKVLEVEKENKIEIQKLKQMKIEFKKATVELNQKINEDSSLAAQLGTARNKLLKTKEELATINAQKGALRQDLAGGVAVSKILELRNKLKGIFGTVAELGQVTRDYALALEVAAGSRIKSVVVDSDKTAAECIKYLKQNRLGVATFLPMNKIKPVRQNQDMQALLSQPGVRGSAMQLIKFDQKYRDVFSYVFGNTLVVDNIDVARSLGVGRERMVTLSGDLVEISGAMQGGFRQRTKGFGFREKELMSEAESLEKQESDLTNVISTLESRRTETEERIASLRELKANLEADIIKTEKTLHLESDDLEVSKNQKKGLKDELVEVETKLRDLRNKIGQCNQSLVKTKMEKQKLREQIMALNNPVLQAELNTFEQKKTELREDLLRIDSDTKNIDVQVSTLLMPEINRIERILKQHDKEQQDFAAEIGKLKTELGSQSKELKEKEARQKEFYEKFKELFKKRDGLSEDVSRLETKLYQTDESRRNQESRLNNVSLDNAKVTAELAGFEEEYKEFEGVSLFRDKPEEEIKKEIWQFEKMVGDLGSVNMRALEIYEAVEKEYNDIINKKNTLVKEREDVLVMMNEIETQKKSLFMETFDVLNEQFQKIFLQLSTKGEAFLELEDPETVFEGGLNLKVRLTGKKFLDIRSLSGGEKTMTALAFLFAVQEHQPASFYALDEVDAALDKRNSERLAEYIRKYTTKAQYLVISHNDGVISEADQLYGISMDEFGRSKVVSLRV